MPDGRRATAAAGAPPGEAGVASPLADSPSFLVRLAQLRAFDEFHQHFAGLGITPAGFSVFALVVANPGVRPGAIAEELRVKPSNVAALVNALVAAGLVERTPDASELRANLLHPTRAGLAAWAEMERSHRSSDARFTERLSLAERARFVVLLRKLLHRWPALPALARPASPFTMELDKRGQAPPGGGAAWTPRAPSPTSCAGASPGSG